MSSASAPDDRHPVVLEVHDLHEEVRAGFGRTALVVRTLDGVSLTVRAGELVVLRGGVASGAASLLNALSGVRGQDARGRTVAPGVRVRRACIAMSAFRAIASAWDVPTVCSEPTVPATRVVYVFRVRASPRQGDSGAGAHPDRHTASDGGAACSDSQASWQAWATALRARAGSVVVQLPSRHVDALSRPVRGLAGTRGTWDTGGTPADYACGADSKAPTIRESSAREMPGRRPEHRYFATGNVRTITLVAGRIVSADPGTRPLWSGSSAGG